jgi:hypothetical protein
MCGVQSIKPQNGLYKNTVGQQRLSFLILFVGGGGFVGKDWYFSGGFAEFLFFGGVR